MVKTIHDANQIVFDIPVPPVRQVMPPEGFVPFDNYPELHGAVALDLETKDPGLARKRGSSWAIPGEGKICGFGIAPLEPCCAPFYVGVGHAGGNSDPEKAVRWLKAQAAKPDVTFVYANAMYDMGWILTRWGIDPVNLPRDVQTMAALLDSDRFKYSLDSLMQDYLGRGKGTKGLRERAKERGILNPYEHMDRLTTWEVAAYGLDDVVGTIDLYKLFLPLLEKEDLGRVFDLESECLLVGRDMKHHGVRVNVERCHANKKVFETRRDAAIVKIKELTGVNVTPWDNAAIAKALQIENPKLEMEKTSQGAVSIRAAVVEAINSPVSHEVRSMRKDAKAIDTFFSGYIEDHVTADSRIHAEFHPSRRTDPNTEETFGVGPGRWSSSGPNLTNVPRRDPSIGKPIRECFEPEEGEDWMKGDYSSQEPRLTTHFAYELFKIRDRLPPDWRFKFGGAVDMVRQYNETPTLSMHKVVAKEMGIDIAADPQTYDMVKILNLGIIYGMQGKKFCMTVGLPTKWITTKAGRFIEVAGEEGQAMMDKHRRLFPWVTDIQKFSTEAVEQREYVTTISGRRNRFKKRYSNGDLMDTYAALNYKVQGSAADQMKYAQVMFRREKITPLVVVHDDTNISRPRGEAGDKLQARVAEIMAHAVELSVPSLAEFKVGPNWGAVG